MEHSSLKIDLRGGERLLLCFHFLMEVRSKILSEMALGTWK